MIIEKVRVGARNAEYDSCYTKRVREPRAFTIGQRRVTSWDANFWLWDDLTLGTALSDSAYLFATTGEYNGD